MEAPGQLPSLSPPALKSGAVVRRGADGGNDTHRSSTNSTNSFHASHLLSRRRISVCTARCYASAVLAMALCPSVCLSVRHKSVFYQNG